MAEALYRKYRPQVFEDVVGQEPIERTRKNALRQGKVSHAYLFCGPRGTGKTTTALKIAEEAGSAKAVNIALMGRLSKYFDFTVEEWMKAIEDSVPPKFLELNKKAFMLGREA